MKQIKLIVTAIALLVVGFANNVTAGCTCGGIPYWCINDATPIPGTTVVTYSTNILVTAGPYNIGSCPKAGASPGTITCAANAGMKKVKAWEISGTAEYEIFGVSAQYGEEQEISADCSGSAIVKDDWCTCCSTSAGIKYKHTYQCGTCACSNVFGDTCSTTVCGTNKEFQQVVCIQNDCTVPADCDPNCPG